MTKLHILLTFSLVFTLVLSDTAIVTYHLYKKYDSLTTVSCSDGANGIMSWGYKDISNMFPYVTAWQPSSWNSPQCGSCAKIMWNGKFIYVTVIDQCGVINKAYSHFDMSRESFTMLFGQQGIAKGTMTANFSIVASKFCQGNKKGVASNPFIRLDDNSIPIESDSVQAKVRSQYMSQSPYSIQPQSQQQQTDESPTTKYEYAEENEYDVEESQRPQEDNRYYNVQEQDWGKNRVRQQSENRQFQGWNGRN